MFFVCGCPKSGTTWVQAMLDRHPQISCAGESQLVTILRKFSWLIDDHNQFQRRRNAAIFGEVPGLAAFPEIDLADERWLYDALVSRLLEKTLRKPGVRAVGDKTPNVAENLAWFHERLPHAKFIHVIRDARDVAVSGWHHLRRASNEADLAEKVVFREYALLIAQLWRDIVGGARAAAVSMPGHYLEIRYEDLHGDADRTLARMLHFFEVDSNAETRRTCINDTRFEALTGGRAAGQEDPRAFLRKGIAGDWRNCFDDTLNGEFLAIAGSLMADLGYDTRQSAPHAVRLDGVEPMAAADPVIRRVGVP
jgi:hypothetical protein